MLDITSPARGREGRRAGGPPAARPSGPRIFQALLTEVERQLRDGDLRPGQRLASERSLADRLGISRASVREGLRVLQTLGLLRTVSGRGRESHTVITDRTCESLSVALRLHAAAGGLSLPDLIETRVVLESAVVRALADRLVPSRREPDRSTGDGAVRTVPAELTGLLDEVESIGRQMRDPEISPAGFHDLDTRFHNALARASGNPLLATLVGALALAERPLVPVHGSLVHRWETACAGLRLQHSALLTAVRRGDATMATALVEDHVRAMGCLLLSPGGGTAGVRAPGRSVPGKGTVPGGAGGPGLPGGPAPLRGEGTPGGGGPVEIRVTEAEDVGTVADRG